MKRPERKPPSKARLRKHLNADALIAGVRREWEKLPDFRNVSPKIPIADVAMSAFAMISLKDPSLLLHSKRGGLRGITISTLCTASGRFLPTIQG